MLAKLLNQLVVDQPLSAADWQALLSLVLADQQRAAAFGISAGNVAEQVNLRAELLQAVDPAVAIAIAPLLQKENQAQDGSSPEILRQTLWDLWLPLALRLAAQRQAAGRPIVQGILGGQGAGKTTLGMVLTLILAHLGYRTLSLSLDDLYKTYADRWQLQQADPRLIWRGPPGTHDVELGIQVLDQLRQAQRTVEVPRFDKSRHEGKGDRAAPELVRNIDIVLFEGWFVGVNPIQLTAFDQALAPILTASDRAFAREMNTRLQDYQPLWERLDRLWVLQLTDYTLSKQWRKHAEHQMIAAGKPGMSDAEIDAFVEYFWKALHPLLFLPPALLQADLVIEINPDHAPGAVFSGAIAR